MDLTPRECLLRLNDSRSVIHGAVSTGAAGAIALVDPRQLGAGGLRSYRAANAAFSGWMTWAVTGTEVADMSRVARAGTVAGAVALTLVSARWSERLDARIHDTLLRCGVRQPRVVLAAASAGVGAASWWRARQPDAGEEGEREPGSPTEA